MHGFIFRIALLGLLAIVACNSNDQENESELPVDSSLVDLMVDLRLLEARAELTHLPDTTYDSLRALTLERHDETDASLARRIEAASNEPKRLERLLEEVQTALSLEGQGEEYQISNSE